MIPLLGFLEGDTLGVLVFAQESDTIDQVGRKLMQAARMRVEPFARFELIHQGEPVNLSNTVEIYGFGLLDRIDVRHVR